LKSNPILPPEAIKQEQNDAQRERWGHFEKTGKAPNTKEAIRAPSKGSGEICERRSNIIIHTNDKVIKGFG
jgi:hypothetical protein